MNHRAGIAALALLLALGAGAARGEAPDERAPMRGRAAAAERELFVPACAHLEGFLGTSWRTDLTVHNGGPSAASYTIQLLARDADNASAAAQTFTLGPGATQRFPDILQQVFGYSGGAALRIVPLQGSVVAVARTYNALAQSGLGQVVRATSRGRAIGAGEEGRIIGLSHDPTLVSGFRTNLGLVNAGAEPIVVEVEYLTQTGRSLGSGKVELAPYAFVQRDRAFEQATPEAVDDGLIVVRSATRGARFFAYASMIDNVSGDAIYLPAVEVE